MATGNDIGKKYGQSIKDFTTASANAVEQVLINHCNEGIQLMRKQIWSKTKTGTASTLAEGLENKPAITTPQSITINTVSNQTYGDFIDKGVKGLRGNKAPGSRYKFKNLGTPPEMINSFKQWIARAGIKSVNGVQTSFKGKKRKTALSEQKQAAKTLAVRTKIGGIRAVKYIEKASNEKRNRALAKQIGQAMGSVIKYNIINDINGNNGQ